LCGSLHAPGEPHVAKSAALFNEKTGRVGVARVGGGYLHPRDKSKSLFNQNKKPSIAHSQSRSMSQNHGGIGVQ